MRKAPAEIRDAEDHGHALAAVKVFERDYWARWPKAVAKVVDDTEVVLSFFDYPAEYRIHLKASNPIESTFAIEWRSGTGMGAAGGSIHRFVGGGRVGGR